MHARSNSVQADPAHLDRLISYVSDDVMTMFQGMPGFVGLSMLADRTSGRCIVTSAGESEEAMRASEERASASRQEAATMAGTDAPRVEEWEVALVHRVHGSHEGACARVVRAHGMSSEEETLAAWRTSVLPALERMEGFCSVSVMADRAGGRGVTSIVYDSRDAMAASAEAGRALRDRFATDMGMTMDEVAEFDVVLARLRVPEMA